jgi:SOS-response transcriptional repressor LexA
MSRVFAEGRDVVKGLTPSRARVLSFLRSYIEAHGYSPSMREIAAGTGHVSTNGAKEMVEKLAREGYIIAPPKGTSRGIVLVDAEKQEFQGVERVELRNIRSALDGLLTHELNLAQFTQALTESFARCGL